MIKQTVSNKWQEKTNVSKKRKSESKISEKDSTSNITSVSVITKSTKPNVVIQAEKFESKNSINTDEKMIFTQICMFVVGIIILLTFFLSLKTYKIVNQNNDIINGTSDTNIRF